MLIVKNPPANTEGTRDVGSIPGSERFLIIGNGNPLHYSSWKIPWIEELGGVHSMEFQRAGHDLVTRQHFETSP